MVYTKNMIKECYSCKIEKPLEEFPNKHGKYYSYCKECKREKDKISYLKNKDNALKRANTYYQENKEKILEKRAQNSEKIQEYNKQYHEQNKEENKARCKNWREENKEHRKLYKQVYNKENREVINTQFNDWLKSNPIAKIAKSCRNRLQEILKIKDLQKNKSFNEYIGCSNDELKMYIEAQFTTEMNWDNYGKIWSIDHKIPLSNAQNEDQVYELNHYLNLQPLEIHKNSTKNNLRSDICWQKLQRDKLIKEDRELGFNFNLKASDFTLQQENITSEHRQFIERYEWLGSCGFGVRHVFTARHDGKLAGVVMIAEPNSYQFDKNLEALIQRGACSSWAPKNLNSRLVMFACRWMVNNTDKRIFVAYSDPKAGEIGTIYQACNFDYLGNNFGSESGYILTNGKVVSDRYFTRTSSSQKWCKELGIKWEKSWCKPNGFQNLKAIPEEVKNQLKNHIKNMKLPLAKIKNEKKGKYVILLKRNPKECIEKTWISIPYPKRINK